VVRASVGKFGGRDFPGVASTSSNRALGVRRAARQGGMACGRAPARGASRLGPSPGAALPGLLVGFFL